MKLTEVKPRFVEFVPDTLEDGIVYVSIPYGAMVHLCCCGCGEKVSTPLDPAQWSLTYDGKQISLSPSVGNGSLPCNSHYIISRNGVQWCAPLTAGQTAAARQNDHGVVVAQYAVSEQPERHGWWRRLVMRVRHRSR